MTLFQNNLEYDITLDISNTYCWVDKIIIHGDISTLKIPEYIFKYRIKSISNCAFNFNYLEHLNKIKCVIIKNNIIKNRWLYYDSLFNCFKNLEVICVNNIILKRKNDKYIIIKL